MMGRLSILLCFIGALALGFGVRASAAPQLDYCAAATAAADSEEDAAELLLSAIANVSQTLDQAFTLYEQAAPAVGASGKPFPLSDRGEGKRLRRTLFFLTIGHWLDVKSALCRCLTDTIREEPACARLDEEVARSCELEPPSRPVNVRCLTKGR